VSQPLQLTLDGKFVELIRVTPLTDRQRELLRYIRAAEDGVRTGEIAPLMAARSSSAAVGALRRLQRRGLVERIGHGHWRATSADESWHPSSWASEPERAQMVALYRAGGSLRSISKELHYSPATIGRALQREGIKLRGRGGAHKTNAMPAEAMLEAAELYGRGWSIAQIADLLGMSVAGVHLRLRRAGTKMRPPGGNNRNGSLRPAERLEWLAAR